MVNTIIIVLLLLLLIVTAVLGAFTLLRYDSRKSAPFIAILVSAFIYTLGYLLQTAAGTVERASISFWVTFIGASYLVPSYMYFVADYCEVRIRKWIAALLIGIPFVYIVLMCTTDSHGLVLASYEYVTSSPVRYLAITPGPLYYVIHIFALVCIAAMYALVIPRLSAADPRARANLILFMAGGLCFVIVDTLFFIRIIPCGINIVHPAATLQVLLLHYCVMRYNLKYISPIASEMVLNSVSDAYILLDRDNKILKANEAACRVFPRLKNLAGGSHVSQIDEWPAELTPRGCNETVAFRMGGDCYYTASVNMITSKNGMTLGCILIIQDITESVRSTRKLEEIAYTDSLTGIYNRRYFINQTAAQLERTRRMNGESYIILFDVDHFKNINDTYGHVVGDEVLKEIVSRVNGAIRPYDLFGRYGGEEFILSVPDINEENIRYYMERLRLAICGARVVVGGVSMAVAASFGASRLTAENGIASAIKTADEALYTAKRNGRNNAVLLLSDMASSVQA